MKHRVRRLPDTPEKISRGIWAGVLISFTPLLGLHFVAAALLAKLLRGNILAAVLATFFGNPVTYLPIAASAIATGNYLLGRGVTTRVDRSLGDTFAGAGRDLWHNFLALFSPAKMEWAELAVFNEQIFLPYLIGGIIPGAICASVVYILARPLISAYQNSRRKKLRGKLDQLKKKSPDETAEISSQ